MKAAAVDKLWTGIQDASGKFVLQARERMWHILAVCIQSSRMPEMANRKQLPLTSPFVH